MGDTPTDTTPGLLFPDLPPDDMIRQSLPFGRLSAAQSLHVLTDAASLSAAEVEHLARKIHECAPKLPQGMSFDETKQRLMSLAGMSGARAGQVLRDQLDRLLRPSNNNPCNLEMYLYPEQRGDNG